MCAVGPYDEIIFVPGLFHRHKTGKDELDYHLSITRIYVSADASTINGRRNWSIPKCVSFRISPRPPCFRSPLASLTASTPPRRHTALFSWTPSSPGGTLLTISHPSSPSSPFFRCLLRDSALTPFSVHIRTSWLEWRLSKWLMQGYSAWLYQPALQGVHGAEEEKVKKARETGQNLEALVGSEEAYRFTPPATAWSRLAKIEVAPPMDGKEEEDWSGFGDGVGFPKFRVATEGALLSLLCVSEEVLILLPRCSSPLRSWHALLRHEDGFSRRQRRPGLAPSPSLLSTPYTALHSHPLALYIPLRLLVYLFLLRRFSRSSQCNPRRVSPSFLLLTCVEAGGDEQSYPARRNVSFNGEEFEYQVNWTQK